MFGSFLYELANITTLGILDDAVDAAVKTSNKSEKERALSMYNNLIQSGHSKEEALEIVKSVYYV